MIEWKIETRPIKSLKKHPSNPRYLSKIQHDHLKTSLEKFGLADKPIINTDGTIIGGHQRIKVLKEMGNTEIEVLIPNRTLEEKEVNELNIRLNKNTGEFDYDILANEWEICDLVEWGFTEKDLELFLNATEEENKTEKEESCKCPTCGKKMKA